jgi:hypothetical protein
MMGMGGAPQMMQQQQQPNYGSQLPPGMAPGHVIPGHCGACNGTHFKSGKKRGKPCKYCVCKECKGTGMKKKKGKPCHKPKFKKNKYHKYGKGKHHIGGFYLDFSSGSSSGRSWSWSGSFSD